MRVWEVQSKSSQAIWLKVSGCQGEGWKTTQWPSNQSWVNRFFDRSVRVKNREEPWAVCSALLHRARLTKRNEWWWVGQLLVSPFVRRWKPKMICEDGGPISGVTDNQTYEWLEPLSERCAHKLCWLIHDSIWDRLIRLDRPNCVLIIIRYCCKKPTNLICLLQ